MKICVDIDGVLADAREYVKEYLIGKNDWDSYFKHTEEFLPITELLALFKHLDEEHIVYAVTGRPESNRSLTENWFRKVIGHYGAPLRMRRDGDFRRTYEIKMEWFRELKPDLIIDDDPAVVEAATKEGFIVLQVHGFRLNGADATPHFSERRKDER